jgi:hypothetical protein
VFLCRRALKKCVKSLCVCVSMCVVLCVVCLCVCACVCVCVCVRARVFLPHLSPPIPFEGRIRPPTNKLIFVRQLLT